MLFLFAAHGADRHGCALRWGCLPPAGERRSGCRGGGRGCRWGETTTPGASERGQQRRTPTATTQRPPGPTAGWCPTSNRPRCPDRGQFQPAPASKRRRSTGYCEFCIYIYISHKAHMYICIFFFCYTLRFRSSFCFSSRLVDTICCNCEIWIGLFRYIWRSIGSLLICT